MSSNGGGPWGGGSGNNNTPRGSGSGGGPEIPDFEEWLKRSQKNFKKAFPGGGKGTGGVKGLLVVALLFWGSTGFYRVSEKEQAVILRFGAVLKTVKESGLHYHLPSPIEEHLIQAVSTKRSFSVGIQSSPTSSRSREEQVFMLTGDENILDVNVTVHWYIKDLGQFLFQVLAPEMTVRVAAESAVREVIAQTPMEAALTKGKHEITARIHQVLQKIADEYQIGIQIDKVNLEKAEAPPTVIEAFRDVQSAQANKEQKVNEALGYRDSIVPVARGEAEKIIQQAEGYRQAVEAKSTGDAQRFVSILQQYRAAPDVTRKHMYIETVEEVLQGAQKVMMSGNTGSAQGVLPYLPLPDLRPKQEKASESQKEAAQ
ncbi:MAG: FtsH protease activity modulator HflK [bacterium]|nr:FtsH protease activity modulator HflK [bacterium]